MLDELNELEKVGLAFISGMVAGQALNVADKEIEEETTKGAKENEKEQVKIEVGKFEGEKAKTFMEFLKDLGVK